MTGRSTAATLAWLRADRQAGRTIWLSKCLMRQRMARGFPSVYPSALAAQHATPMSDRIHDQSKFGQGMVIFLDNPNDSNPFGHVVCQTGRNAAHKIVVDTNDALIRGGGSLVTIDWFPAHWGVPVVFAATSLNGFDLDLPDFGPKPKPHPKPEPKPTLANVQYAEHRMTKAIKFWRDEGQHPGLVKALIKDREQIRQTLREFGRG